MRLRQLDILRALAVFLVLGRHYELPDKEVAAGPRWLAFAWNQVGWIGVDVFFVLSGFLVGGLLFTEYQRYGRVDVGRFLVRRGFKIYPAFWVLLLASFAKECAAGSPSGDWWRRLGYELAYLQNYGGSLWNHTWSLAVEEHFYFVLALLVLALVARRPHAADPFRPLVTIIPAIGVIVLAWRVYTTATRPYDHLTHLFPTHLRIDSLFWGVLLAHAYHFGDRRWLTAVRRHWPLAVAASVVLASPALLLLGSSVILPTVGFTAIAWSAVMLVALALAWATPTGAAATSRRPLRALGSTCAVVGEHSYSIYLWHMPVVLWVLPMLDGWGWFASADRTTAFLLRYAAYLLIAVVGGMVAAQLVERPMLALRDRRFPSRAAAVETSLSAAA